MNIHDVNLQKLNSLTKYPSIPTYHAIGDKGRLAEEVLVPFEADDKIIVTEKIDGTNARIIVWKDPLGTMATAIANRRDPDLRAAEKTILIGSREELLTATGDLIFNPAQGIVEAIRHINPVVPGGLTVIYGEVYGGKIQAAGKMYSPAGKTGFRIFDVVQMSFDEVEPILAMDRDAIARWRDDSGQPFMDEKKLRTFGYETNIPLVPRRGTHTDWIGDHGEQKCSFWFPFDSPLVHSSIIDAYKWLGCLADPSTRAAVDGPGGRPEGIVIRTPDRKKIAKLRFEDYERTLRKR